MILGKKYIILSNNTGKPVGASNITFDVVGIK